MLPAIAAGLGRIAATAVARGVGASAGTQKAAGGAVGRLGRFAALHQGMDEDSRKQPAPEAPKPISVRSVTGGY